MSTKAPKRLNENKGKDNKIFVNFHDNLYTL